MSKHIDEKAQRLLDNRKVGKSPAEVFVVQGDTDRYMVIWIPIAGDSEVKIKCNCQRGQYDQECSHARAVGIFKEEEMKEL